MGSRVDPALLTRSGEQCLHRLSELPRLGLPPAQLITVIVTVVEGHVSRVLNSLIVLSDVDSNPLGHALLIRQADNMDSTWDNRKHWLKSAFDVDYAGSSAYQGLEVLVEARNAVVHGDGSLTERQKRPLKKLLSLRSLLQSRLGATLQGRLYFGEATSERAMEIARLFVLEFDKMVIEKHPEARGL